MISQHATLITRPLCICFLANAFQFTAFSVLLHLPGFLKTSGANEVQIGSISAAISLLAVVSSPFLGRFLDARDPRVVIFAANLANVLATLGLLYADRFNGGLIALLLLRGLAGSVLYASLLSYAADVIPLSRRAQGLGLFGTSALMSIGLGAVAGEWARSAGGFTRVFELAFALSAIAFFIALTLPRTPSNPPAVEKPSQTTGQQSAPTEKWWSLLLQRNLLGLWLAEAAFFGAMASLFVFLSTWALQSEIGSLGEFFAVFTTVAIAVRLLLGWLPERASLENIVVGSMLIYAIGIAGIGFVTSAEQLYAAAVFCGVGHGLGFPVLLTLIAQRAGSGKSGRAIALFAGIDEGATLISAPILGALIQFSGYGTMFICASLILATAAVGFKVWDQTQSRAGTQKHTQSDAH